MILPTFIVCGAAKCGTTSIYHYLKKHPDILMSRNKEPNFFNRHYDAGIEEYKSQFCHYSGELEVGESSVSYIADADLVAPRIKKHIPDVKLIFSLRNPIERLWSGYWFAVACGRIRAHEVTFSEFIRLKKMISHFGREGIDKGRRSIEVGMYYMYMSKYMEYFPAEQIHVIIHEEMAKDQLYVVKNVYDFLGVNELFTPSKVTKNKTRKPKHDWLYKAFYQTSGTISRFLDKKSYNYVKSKLSWIRDVVYDDNREIKMKMNDREYLYHIYKDDISKLETLISRDLSNWKVSG